MRSNPILAPVAIAAQALAAPPLHAWTSSFPVEFAASHTILASNEPIKYAPAQVATLTSSNKVPKPTPAFTLNLSSSEGTASWTTVTTSIIISNGGLDPRFPFSWGPWMLPPIEDITCSVASSTAPNWDSPDFPWIIPPRKHMHTEAPTTMSTAPLPRWTESAPGSWGFQPREGVTCMGTTSMSTSSVAPFWGGGGTSFYWGLPPRDDHASTEASMAMATAAPSDLSTIFVTILSTATLAEENLGGLSSTLACKGKCEVQTAAVKRQLDVTTALEMETAVVTSTVIYTPMSDINTPPSLLSSPTESDSNLLPLTTSHKAIPTLSATKGPDLVTASSAWVDGLPPPIPFDSIIFKTLTLDIPEHGTTVADTSTWFGPWPSSTEMPFVTSPIIIQTTPTTFLTLPKSIDVSATATSSSSIECNEEYCDEDGTSYCFYWAGVTTMGQHGPEPGETRVPKGACSVSAEATTTTAVRGRQFGPRRMHMF